MELQDGVRQLLANPVMEDGKVTGGVLLLVDVTEKTQREALRREFTANVSHESRNSADFDFRLCRDHADGQESLRMSNGWQEKFMMKPNV